MVRNSSPSLLLSVYLLLAIALFSVPAVARPLGSNSKSLPSGSASNAASAPLGTVLEPKKIMVGRLSKSKWVEKGTAHDSDDIAVLVIGDDAFAAIPIHASVGAKAVQVEVVRKFPSFKRLLLNGMKLLNPDYFTTMNAQVQFKTLGGMNLAFHNLRNIVILQHVCGPIKDSFGFVDCALAYLKSYYLNYNDHLKVKDAWNIYKDKREQELRRLRTIRFGRQTSNGKWLATKPFLDDQIYVLFIGNVAFAAEAISRSESKPTNLSEPAGPASGQASPSLIPNLSVRQKNIISDPQTNSRIQLLGYACSNFSSSSMDRTFRVIRDIPQLQEKVNMDFRTSFDYIEGAMKFLSAEKYLEHDAMKEWQTLKGKFGVEQIQKPIAVGRISDGQWVNKREKYQLSHIDALIIGDNAFAAVPLIGAQAVQVEMFPKFPENTEDYFTSMAANARFETVGRMNTAFNNLKQDNLQHTDSLKDVCGTIKDSLDFVGCALAYIKLYHLDSSDSDQLNKAWTGYKRRREMLREMRKIRFGRQTLNGKWLASKYPFLDDQIFVLYIGNVAFAAEPVSLPKSLSGPAPTGEASSSSSLSSVREKSIGNLDNYRTGHIQLLGTLFNCYSSPSKDMIFKIIHDIPRLQEKVNMNFHSSFDYIEGAMKFMTAEKCLDYQTVTHWQTMKDQKIVDPEKEGNKNWPGSHEDPEKGKKRTGPGLESENTKKAKEK